MNGPLSTLDIDLDAVAWNYLFLKKRLKAGADCAAVVKTDAYGLGAEKIAQALHAQNCRHFFVAAFEEGAALRAALAGKQAAIYILNGPNGAAAEDFAARGLIPVLCTPGDIENWGAFAARSGRKQPAILHIDTGMNRLGLTGTEARALDKAALAPFDIRYVMSHLACGDDLAHPKNARQLEDFRSIMAAFPLPARLSLANSGGVMLGQKYHFDLARPGCALYGINPQPIAQNPLRGVVTLKARILQIREIDRDGTVGYGAAHPVVKSMKTATISAGYGDGYFRGLEGRGAVHINGARCPVIGRISMDYIVADITTLRIPPKPGDFAEIIGENQLVDDIAAQAGTIGYEVLTALGKRYQRTYTGSTGE